MADAVGVPRQSAPGRLQHRAMAGAEVWLLGMTGRRYGYGERDGGDGEEAGSKGYVVYKS